MRKFLAFILLLCSPLWGISVENGATDVTVYFNLHDTDGTMLTGETVIPEQEAERAEPEQLESSDVIDMPEADAAPDAK